MMHGWRWLGWVACDKKSKISDWCEPGLGWQRNLNRRSSSRLITSSSSILSTSKDSDLTWCLLLNLTTLRCLSGYLKLFLKNISRFWLSRNNSKYYRYDHFTANPGLCLKSWFQAALFSNANSGQNFGGYHPLFPSAGYSNASPENLSYPKASPEPTAYSQPTPENLRYPSSSPENLSISNNGEKPTTPQSSPSASTGGVDGEQDEEGDDEEDESKPEYSNLTPAAPHQSYPTLPQFSGFPSYQPTFHQMYRQPEGFLNQQTTGHHPFPFHNQLPNPPNNFPWSHQPPHRLPQPPHHLPQAPPRPQLPYLTRPPHLPNLPRQSSPPPTPASSTPSPPQMRQVRTYFDFLYKKFWFWFWGLLKYIFILQIYQSLPPTPDSAPAHPGERQIIFDDL